MKLTTKKIGAAFILLCPAISYGMEKTKEQEQFESFTKLVNIVDNLQIPDDALEKLLAEVCKPDYTGQLNQKLRDRGKNRAATVLLFLYKAQDYGHKISRVMLQVQSLRPFCVLNERLKAIDPNSPSYITICQAIKELATGAQECLQKATHSPSTILGTVENEKNSTDNQKPYEKLYLEYYASEIKICVDFLEKLKATPAQIDELELQYCLSSLKCKLAYLETGVQNGFAQEFANLLQLAPDCMPIDEQIKHLKDMILSKESAKNARAVPNLTINAHTYAERGKNLAQLFLNTLYSENIKVLKNYNEDFTRSFGECLAVLGSLCHSNPVESNNHQEALAGLRTLFQAFADVLSTVPYEATDFSKGKNQNLIIEHAEVNNECMRAVFKCMQDFVSEAATIDSFATFKQLMLAWAMKDTQDRAKFAAKVQALQNGAQTP